MSVEKHPCAGKVYDSSSIHPYPCSKNGTYEETGKWWCHSHAPSKVAARRAARTAKWDAAWADRSKGREESMARADRLSRYLGVRVHAQEQYINGKFVGFLYVLRDALDIDRHRELS